MAWNEPGGDGKQRDPWGGNEGPPDLDEAFRKFRAKLGGVMGGRPSDKQLNGGVAGLIVAGILAIWAVLGFNSIDEKERAVVLRLGRFHEVLAPGLNWNPPLVDAVIPVNITQVREHRSRGLMLTQDENIVELPITVQYDISDVKAFVLNVRDPEFSLEQASDSALRHVVGSSKLNQVLSDGRGEIGDDVRLKLQSYLDNYGTGIRVVKVTIQEGSPPSEVKTAFDDVTRAREDQERLKNEAKAYANGIIPEARGRAQRMLEEAAAYRGKVVADAQGESQRFEKLLAEYQKAPQVTRERLYIDAVERVLSGTPKVMVDVSGSNNLLYLPLDKLANPQGGDAATQSATGAASDQAIGVAGAMAERGARDPATGLRPREGR